MSTGRRIAERAIRQPMLEIGWRPRAAGWFTREIAPGFLGVVALSAASSGYPKSAAAISLHVGLRDESLEPLVAQLCGIEDRGYQSRTVVTPIGYLLPEHRWRDWHIDAESVDAVSAELGHYVNDYALRYLNALATDAGVMLKEARTHRISWPGTCRVAVLTACIEGHGAAEAFLAGIDPTIEVEAQMLSRLRQWMTNSHSERP